MITVVDAPVDDQDNYSARACERTLDFSPGAVNGTLVHYT